MKRSDRFKNMDEVRTEKARLRAAREGYRYNLKEHWTVLGEKDFRRGLVGDLFSELFTGWRPLRSVMAFFDERPQALASLAGSVLGAKKNTLWGRALTWGLTAASPYLSEKIAGNRSGSTLINEVRRSWDRIRDYVRQRKAAYSNGMHHHHDGNGVHEGMHQQ